jgi:nitroimidazol reductase NimA-like FMN-containing flavoprotein (pyridoxamine 5'-phosphate oxidase superfamily)
MEFVERRTIKMPEKEPVAKLLVDTGHGNTIPWSKALRQLSESDTYWLATVRPDNRPHLMPVLAVWLDNAMFFCANASSRKAKNIASVPYCVISTEHHKLHLVVEGKAERVQDNEVLLRVAGGFAAKYGWEVSVRDGAFYAEGAPTAGPPPYTVYQVNPSTIFGFGTDDTLNATRWRF